MRTLSLGPALMVMFAIAEHGLAAETAPAAATHEEIESLGRSVHVAYAVNLGEGLKRFGGGVDLIIGKRSSVVADAAECNVPVSAIAMLTDLTGSTDLTGLFVVRHDDPARAAVLKALLAVREDPSLLKDMESKNGFVAITRPEPWPDWRGRRRDAISAYVPARLPERPAFLWKHHLTGLGLSGVAATAQYVIVADKDAKAENDIFRCLDANTGNELWALTYPAAGEMDYSNAPRANPVIHDGLVYLLGAFGHLHCVKLDTGEIVWKRNVIEDFGAELQMWGMCVAPLIADDKLIVNPGAEDASVVALSPTTGKVVWQTPGNAAAYAAFIVGTFGGVRQIVGYDALSLGGWDIATGERLWELVPEEDGDFNVPTPISVGGELLLIEASEKRFELISRLRLFDDAEIWSHPALVGDHLYVRDHDAVYCVVLGR
jgi:hypothetical protein